MLKVALNTINHLYKFCKVIKFYTHCISNIKCTYMYNSKHMCNVFLNFLFLWLFSPDIWQSYICIYSKVIFINIYLDICMLFKVGCSTYRYINILMVSHVTAPIILNKNKKIESHIVYTVPVYVHAQMYMHLKTLWSYYLNRKNFSQRRNYARHARVTPLYAINSSFLITVKLHQHEQRVIPLISNWI